MKSWEYNTMLSIKALQALYENNHHHHHHQQSMAKAHSPSASTLVGSISLQRDSIFDRR